MGWNKQGVLCPSQGDHERQDTLSCCTPATGRGRSSTEPQSQPALSCTHPSTPWARGLQEPTAPPAPSPTPLASPRSSTLPSNKAGEDEHPCLGADLWLCRSSVPPPADALTPWASEQTARLLPAQNR